MRMKWSRRTRRNMLLPNTNRSRRSHFFFFIFIFRCCVCLVSFAFRHSFIHKQQKYLLLMLPPPPSQLFVRRCTLVRTAQTACKVYMPYTCIFFSVVDFFFFLGQKNMLFMNYSADYFRRLLLRMPFLLLIFFF